MVSAKKYLYTLSAGKLKWCWSGRCRKRTTQGNRGSEAGVVLWETLAALMMSTFLLGSLLHVGISWGWEAAAVMQQTEADGSWASVERVIRRTVHAAVSTGGSSGSITLYAADGQGYSIYRNGQGQVVQVRSGGGTSVLGTGVNSVSWTTGRGVGLTLTDNTGQVRSLYAAALPDVLP
ncbi:MAG: hypothetical protein K6T31_03805 [Alicyclobacillus sp.]|nr:hypothetical protein [Alicyclobacillus sp.]